MVIQSEVQIGGLLAQTERNSRTITIRTRTGQIHHTRSHIFQRSTFLTFEGKDPAAVREKAKRRSRAVKGWRRFCQAGQG